jgi:hypothetical protein
MAAQGIPVWLGFNKPIGHCNIFSAYISMLFMSSVFAVLSGPLVPAWAFSSSFKMFYLLSPSWPEGPHSPVAPGLLLTSWVSHIRHYFYFHISFPFVNLLD